MVMRGTRMFDSYGVTKQEEFQLHCASYIRSIRMQGVTVHIFILPRIPPLPWLCIFSSTTSWDFRSVCGGLFLLVQKSPGDSRDWLSLHLMSRLLLGSIWPHHHPASWVCSFAFPLQHDLSNFCSLYESPSHF